MSNDVFSRWISVEDRLPETDDRVLVWYCDKDGDFFPAVGRYGEKEERWITDVDDNDHAWPPVKITHWMPLPEPPKV